MARDVLFSINRRSGPRRASTITLAEIEALAKTRKDVEVRVGETGTRLQRDMIVVDPTGKANGDLLLINGALLADNPDEATLRWMLELSQAFNARPSSAFSSSWGSS